MRARSAADVEPVRKRLRPLLDDGRNAAQRPAVVLLLSSGNEVGAGVGHVEDVPCGTGERGRSANTRSHAEPRGATRSHAEPRHHITTAPYHYNTTTPQHHNTTTPRHHDTTTSLHHKTTRPQHQDTATSQRHTTTPPQRLKLTCRGIVTCSPRVRASFLPSCAARGPARETFYSSREIRLGHGRYNYS